MITPLLDPVVASKIVFTKNLEDLKKFIDSDGLPVIITGDKSKPSLDDLPSPRPPQAGSKSIPADIPVLILYWDTVATYELNTRQWAKIPEFGGDEDAINRLKLGYTYRITRVKAEKILRGETSYHTKGLVLIDENDRLIINYNTSSWVKKDITDWV